MLRRFFPDPFIFWLLGAVVVASLLPVRGALAQAVDALTLAAIFALFFLHGVRLPREALVSGVTDWRLHAAILAITFGVFPLVGLGLSAMLPGLLSPALWTGMLFLCALPSTVQSSIAYTSMAHGNVAGAVAAAAYSNLIGVFLTPLLVSLLLETQGASASLTGIGKIVALLFCPSCLDMRFGRGCSASSLTGRGSPPSSTKAPFCLRSTVPFSAAMVEGLWSRIPPASIAVLVALCLFLLAVVLGASWTVGRLGGFSRESRAAILFCGSVKSLASGAPMARILFPGAAAGMVILPIMLFHSFQLIVCAWIAAGMGAQNSPEVRSE